MGSTSVRVVYRFHDGENTKPRPAWYDKTLALFSLVRAVGEADAARAPVTLVFLTDGPVSPRPAAVMRAAGEVVPISGGSNRRSYRAMIAREAELATRSADGDGVVWFAEDDYLYRPDALARLSGAADAVPAADWFTMHSPECLDPTSGRLHPRLRPRPGAADDPRARALDGVDWFRAFSTTSTFGLRRRALARDARLLRLAPLSGGAWDTTSCLLAQGLRPFSRRELADDLAPPGGVRSAARGALRVALSGRAARRRSHRRVLIGSDPELVHHMEPPETSPLRPPSDRTLAYDWAALAADTARWARDEGWDV